MTLYLKILCVVVAAVSSASADSPNVVVIMADDMGYSDLGCFGGEIETPNLNLLAHGGLRFTNFYSENMCWVSRAAMLTGIYHKTSMVDNAIHPRCVTLAEALRASGYQTRMSGKWHLAGRPYHVFPNDRGFDEFYGILGGAASFFAPAFLCRNRANVEAEAQDDPDYYFTDAISNESTRMVRTADASRPLLLSVAYTAAHWPLHAKEKDILAYRGKYAMGWDRLRQQRLQRMKELGIVPRDMPLSVRNPKVPPWIDEPHQKWQQRRMEVYAAQVTAMDRGIGQLMEALKETGRFDNTLVLFTIDNGGCHVEYTPDRVGDYLPQQTRDGRPMRPGNLPEIMPGPEDTYQSYGHGWANASNTPYRQFKQFDHEGGIRTPMIAHWPTGIAQPGSLVRSVSHLIDIMPTILEVTETSVPEEIGRHEPIEMDGHSLASTFKGQDVAGHETLFFAHAKGRAIRHGNWKLVAESKRPWELYDLRLDPTEERNLAKEMPQRVIELEAIWEAESQRLAENAKLP
jgi:arylsulfatase A-like enzyme